MEKEIIKEKVNEQVNQWTILQSKIGMEWYISSKAIDLMTELIENIKEDPSLTWNKNLDYENSQEYAITLIPNMLNELIQGGNRVIKRKRTITDGKLTSWEILHSLSKTIDKWCFVPKV